MLILTHDGRERLSFSGNAVLPIHLHHEGISLIQTTVTDMGGYKLDLFIIYMTPTHILNHACFWRNVKNWIADKPNISTNPLVLGN
jgi:hypothetical protein